MKPRLYKLQDNDILLKKDSNALTPISTKINLCQVKICVTENFFQKAIYKLESIILEAIFPILNYFNIFYLISKNPFKNSKHVYFHSLNNQYFVLHLNLQHCFCIDY